MIRLREAFENALVRFWIWREKPEVAQGGPIDSVQYTDNVMRTMNLVMPLKDKTAVGRATATAVVAGALDEIYSGLDNVGTVHFARFSIVDNNLLMFSFYDGDFHTYIRDFIITLGHAFDGIVSLVEDPPPLPCKHNVEEFVQWVHVRDCFQVPTNIPDIAVNLDDPRKVSRELILRLEKNPNVQIGAYRAYPGYSVAQVRSKLGVGW